MRRRRGDDYQDEADREEQDSPLSVASCLRQARRAGRRWGLDAVERDGRVCLVEQTRSLDGGAGVCEIARGARHDVSTVDDEHPFTAALFNRIGNGELEVAARAREFDRLKRNAEKAKARETAEEMRARWLGRRRSVFIGPDLYVPAGLTNRRSG